MPRRSGDWSCPGCTPRPPEHWYPARPVSRPPSAYPHSPNNDSHAARGSPASRLGLTLNTFDLRGLQAEIENCKILPHVAGAGGAGQGHHADVEGEAEDHLIDVPAVASSDPRQFG